MFECKNACTADNNCKAWAFDHSKEQGVCRLKNAVPKAFGATCCSAGVRDVAAATPPQPKSMGHKQVTAARDTNIYDSPTQPRKFRAIMRARTQGNFNEYHPDGFCRVTIASLGVSGWVYQGDISNCP